MATSRPLLLMVLGTLVLRFLPGVYSMKSGTGGAVIIDERNGVVYKRACYDPGHTSQYCCSAACKSPDTGSLSISIIVSSKSETGCAAIIDERNGVGYKRACYEFGKAGQYCCSAACTSPDAGSLSISMIVSPKGETGDACETDPFPSETNPILHRNRRWLLSKPAANNAHFPGPTSDEKSWNLNKLDPPTPPSPRAKQPNHQ